MDTAYDLLRGDWIPCVTNNGVACRGILDTLKGASTIREIASASPLVSFGLYRFLLALIQWCAPVADTREWRALWAKDGSRITF